MSIYHTMFEHLDAYIESLGGARSTIDESYKWVSRGLYHHDESIRLLGAITMHNLALDRGRACTGTGGSMTTKNTGGNAFPTQSWEYDGGGRVLQYQEPGMSLRDWFAGMAMQGMLTGGEHQEVGWKRVVDAAYEYADAMLKAREEE